MPSGAWHLNQKQMKTLIVSTTTFENMISGLIASGVTFEAVEIPGGLIKVNFTGGF